MVLLIICICILLLLIYNRINNNKIVLPVICNTWTDEDKQKYQAILLKKKKKAQNIYIGVSIFVLFILLVGQNQENKPYIPDERDAYYISQSFVKNLLKSPSTADFPYYSDIKVYKHTDDMNMFSVRAYVDAQNGFGAQIRTYYNCTVKHVGLEKWQLIDINFDE